jgi:hypothetical protein
LEALPSPSAGQAIEPDVTADAMSPRRLRRTWTSSPHACIV